jgi:large subunit ribosomal protein L30
MGKKLQIKLKKSFIGRMERHRTIARTLGVKKPNDVVYHNDTPQIRGMIKAISYMLDVEELNEA